eukprot:1177128-Prorocentrum_minimum.AAC.1
MLGHRAVVKPLCLSSSFYHLEPLQSSARPSRPKCELTERPPFPCAQRGDGTHPDLRTRTPMAYE